METRKVISQIRLLASRCLIPKCIETLFQAHVHLRGAADAYKNTNHEDCRALGHEIVILGDFCFIWGSVLIAVQIVACNGES